MRKKYEIEIQRSGISPKRFFTYCKKQLEKKGHDIYMWFDSYEGWSSPYDRCEWTKTDNGKITSFRSYEFQHQIYDSESYNFIMEFDFYDEKNGFGYLYLSEW